MVSAAEYALLLFGPDGIKRERMRMSRGFAVIRSHPLWFLSVMARRGVDSLRLDRVPLLAAEAPVTQRWKQPTNSRLFGSGRRMICFETVALSQRLLPSSWWMRSACCASLATTANMGIR